jgi:alpha-L-fucosidase
MCYVRCSLTFIIAMSLAATANGLEFKNVLTKDSIPGWEEKETNGLWSVEDGVLICKGGGNSNVHGWIQTKRDYTDFIIELEYQLPPGGNSGVFLRIPKEGYPTYVGMEIQVLDDNAEVYKNIEPGQFCGSLYKIAPATKHVTKKAGEWNKMRITADADHIVSELNGEVVVDANAQANPEILNRSKKGPIGLQDHSTTVLYRNIRIADIAADRAERSAWWREAKFGMFIHWGVYSVLGHGEWVMHVNKIPAAEYEKLPPQFNPTEFDAEAWAGLAKRAGVKYVVITSKHHDGFAMFDSKVSDYDIVDRTPYKKDPMKPLSDACRKQGLHFGFYHSILDWHHPDYAPVPPWDTEARAKHPPNFDKYLEYMQGEVRELCTNYGPLACIWWDGGWDHGSPEDKVKLAKVNAMIRELQPQILINNRSNIPEDFDTPEQFIPPTGITNADGSPKLWESCITTTVHGWWGYDKDEKEFKTPEYCIRMLIDIVSKGGNLLLNVGPDPTGKIGPNETKTLEKMGEWLATNGEAIYGTTASPFRYLPFFGKATVKGKTLYLHVFNWPSDGRLVLPGLKNNVTGAHVLGSGSADSLKPEKDGHDWVIHLPKTAPDTIAGVVAVELDGSPNVEPYFIRPDADGNIVLSALYMDIRATHGQRARLEVHDEQVNLGNWTNPKDNAAWKFEVPKEGVYEVSMVYGADPASADSKFVIAVGGAELSGQIQATGSTEKFESRKLGELKIPAGQQTLMVKPVTIPPEKELMKLRQVTLTPKK